MRLIIDHKDMTVQSGTVPMRWCLYRKELEELEERGVNKPYVLIVITNGSRQYRYLVPMDQMMTYIQFHRPGENTVHAVIVWHKKDNVKELQNFFLSSFSRWNYANEVFYDIGELYPEFRKGCRRLKESEELTVTVPKKLFAPEPSDFEKWWVNLWHEVKQVDECDFRKRRISAYSAQPPLMLVWIMGITAVRFIAALVLSIAGMRGTDWSPVIHPFRHKTKRVWSYTTNGDSVFRKRDDGTKHPWYIRILTPPVYIITVALLIFGGFLGQVFSIASMMSLWYYAALGVVLPIAIITVAAVAYIVSKLAWALLTALIFKPTDNWLERNYEGWGSKLEKRKRERERLANERERKRDELKAELQRQAEEQLRVEREELLSCNGELQPSINALPPSKRTVHLRFLDLKAQICKPYAQ